MANLPFSADATVLTIKEIAEFLRVNERTVRRWINDGSLPALQLGREYRIDREDFRSFCDARKTGAERHLL